MLQIESSSEVAALTESSVPDVHVGSAAAGNSGAGNSNEKNGQDWWLQLARGEDSAAVTPATPAPQAQPKQPATVNPTPPDAPAAPAAAVTQPAADTESTSVQQSPNARSEQVEESGRALAARMRRARESSQIAAAEASNSAEAKPTGPTAAAGASAGARRIVAPPRAPALLRDPFGLEALAQQQQQHQQQQQQPPSDAVPISDVEALASAAGQRSDDEDPTSDHDLADAHVSGGGEEQHSDALSDDDRWFEDFDADSGADIPDSAPEVDGVPDSDNFESSGRWQQRHWALSAMINRVFVFCV